VVGFLWEAELDAFGEDFWKIDLPGDGTVDADL
jgi:hypothetical protein